MRKKILIAASIAVGAFAVLGIAAAVFIDVDTFRPQLERALSSAVGRPVTMGHIALSILSGSAEVQDLSVGDDRAFGSAPFLTAKTVRVGIAVLPLILQRRLDVESLRLQRPELTLRRSASGAWNFSTLAAGSSAGSRAASSPALGLSIDRFTIGSGRVTIVTTEPHAQPRVYEGVTVDVRELSATARFRFRITGTTPGGGELDVDGSAGPLSAGGIGSTPLDATIDARRIDIARSGFVAAASGIAGVVDGRIVLSSDGTRIKSSGTARAARVQLVPGGAPATRAVELVFASEYDASTHDGRLTTGDLHVGGAVARLLGRFSTRPPGAMLRLGLTGHGMPLTDLEALLPAVGAGLPRGARLRTGTLEAELTVAGPLDQLVIAGPVAASNVTLSGFDLGSQLQKVAAFGGLPSRAETTVQSLRVTVRIAPDGIRADGLSCVAPAVGTLDGSGTIAPNGTLDFRMLVKLAHTGGVAGEIARVASLGSPASGVPFRIQGTTAAPVFVPDVSRAATQALKDPNALSKVTGLARSIFGRKK